MKNHDKKTKHSGSKNQSDKLASKGSNCTSKTLEDDAKQLKK